MSQKLINLLIPFISIRSTCCLPASYSLLSHFSVMAAVKMWGFASVFIPVMDANTEDVEEQHRVVEVGCEDEQLHFIMFSTNTAKGDESVQCVCVSVYGSSSTHWYRVRWISNKGIFQRDECKWTLYTCSSNAALVGDGTISFGFPSTLEWVILLAQIIRRRDVASD